MDAIKSNIIIFFRHKHERRLKYQITRFRLKTTPSVNNGRKVGALYIRIASEVWNGKDNYFIVIVCLGTQCYDDVRRILREANDLWVSIPTLEYYNM